MNFPKYLAALFSGDTFSYEFAGIDTLATNTPHTLTTPIASPNAVLTNGNSNGIMDFNGPGELFNVVVSGFSSDSSDRLEITIHEIRIEAIPEPSSVVLLSLFGGKLALRRRRNRI